MLIDMCLAFHGSYTENWHSSMDCSWVLFTPVVLRNGLRNASGTKFQLHGAAYGSGIYISPHAAVSFGYTGGGYNYYGGSV